MTRAPSLRVQYRWRTCGLLICCGLLASCEAQEAQFIGPDGPEPHASTRQAATRDAPLALWPQVWGLHVIPICFRNSGVSGNDGNTGGPCAPSACPYVTGYSNPTKRAERKALVKDALLSSWGKWTNIAFTGWGDCAAPANGEVAIDMIDIESPNVFDGCGVPHPPGSGGGGRCGNVMQRGFNNSIPHVIWLSLDATNDPLYDDNWRRTVTIHEFGHQLGIRHEHDRPYATGYCSAPQDFNGVGLFWTSWYDDTSVMSYCGPPSRNGLSFGDIEGVSRTDVYGESPARRWLRALPAITYGSF